MVLKPELRIGALLVTRDRAQRFVLQDSRDPDLRQMELDDVFVPELIKFLHQWSTSSQRHLRVDYLSDPQGPHVPTDPTPPAAPRQISPYSADRDDPLE